MKFTVGILLFGFVVSACGGQPSCPSGSEADQRYHEWTNQAVLEYRLRPNATPSIDKAEHEYMVSDEFLACIESHPMYSEPEHR